MIITRRTPFAPGAARELLRSSPEFLDLVGDDPAAITTRELPDPLTGPCVTIYTGVNRRQNIEMSKARLLVSVWVPKSEVLVDRPVPILTDPEELSWDIADLAGRIFDQRRGMGTGRSFEFRGATWRAEWDAGPTTMVDRERGVENPLYRSVIEVLMKLGSGPR
ncbi:hypothetical protein [Gordonia sp. (in: high G+C Gram-positive bacteria)]|uniref:hypothetical protein n=1 Tax=Gordonia sp. (in: high G+C Gram-positive bacteria) TaxID=84139 RepID=UPI003C764ECE